VKFSFPFSPDALLPIAEHFSEFNGSCLLYSGGQQETAQFSFLFLFPYESCSIDSSGLWHQKGQQRKNHSTASGPWQTLKSIIGSSIVDGEPSPEWVGFFSYEMGAFADAEKPINHFPPPHPYAFFQRSAVILRVDHRKNEGVMRLNPEAEAHLALPQKEWFKRFWIEGIQAMHDIPLKTRSQGKISRLCQLEDYSEYKNKIDRALEYIRAGDIYQVNLSHLLSYQSEGIDRFSLFKDLARQNPAPFSAYFNHEDWTIVSSSPERYLKRDFGALETRPIKGTLPRGKTLEEDRQQKERLLSSEKERAELLMITDLMRNDLARISLPGTVRALAMWQCEAYTNVFHLHSVIQAESNPALHPLDQVRLTFPGGSITGCPKLRAMEVIAEIEQRPRGIYTGSIGYFSGNGDFDFNIAIRTVFIRKGLLDLQLGGGIVSDSIPLKEYEETLHKGETFFRIFNNG